MFKEKNRGIFAGSGMPWKALFERTTGIHLTCDLDSGVRAGWSTLKFADLGDSLSGTPVRYHRTELFCPAVGVFWASVAR